MTAEPHGGPSFAQRLDLLFQTVVDPLTGKTYSVRSVASALTAAGYPVSHTHLTNLRSGKAPNPRLTEMEAIARFFQVPLSYFTDVEGAEQAAHRAEIDQFNTALAQPAIKLVALRMANAGLSEEGIRAIVAMVDHVARLEDAARRARKTNPLWDAERRPAGPD